MTWKPEGDRLKRIGVSVMVALLLAVPAMASARPAAPAAPSQADPVPTATTTRPAGSPSS